ncbi:hypothetical protein FRB95_011165 [Tulasnella sp. JGI-2019a]|nr:hypothetical protein FRB95_011165 [Tulasnella sp. JGI-2019a]
MENLTRLEDLLLWDDYIGEALAAFEERYRAQVEVSKEIPLNGWLQMGGEKYSGGEIGRKYR